MKGGVPVTFPSLSMVWQQCDQTGLFVTIWVAFESN